MSIQKGTIIKLVLLFLFIFIYGCTEDKLKNDVCRRGSLMEPKVSLYVDGELIEDEIDINLKGKIDRIETKGKNYTVLLTDGDKDKVILNLVMPIYYKLDMQEGMYINVRYAPPVFGIFGSTPQFLEIYDKEGLILLIPRGDLVAHINFMTRQEWAGCKSDDIWGRAPAYLICSDGVNEVKLKPGDIGSINKNYDCVVVESIMSDGSVIVHDAGESYLSYMILRKPPKT